MAGVAIKLDVTPIGVTKEMIDDVNKKTRTIKRADVVKLNQVIEPRIRQNEMERVASEEEVAGTLVGWKWE